MRRTASRLAALPLALLLIAGCLHSANNRPQRDPNVILQDEIERAGGTDALNVIQRLRGEFLSDRGRVTISGGASPLPTVYVDGTRYGDTSILRQIPASQLLMVRLYRAWEAQTKFGTGNAGGVIEITTRR